MALVCASSTDDWLLGEEAVSGQSWLSRPRLVREWNVWMLFASTSGSGHRSRLEEGHSHSPWRDPSAEIRAARQWSPRRDSMEWARESTEPTLRSSQTSSTKKPWSLLPEEWIHQRRWRARREPFHSRRRGAMALAVISGALRTPRHKTRSPWSQRRSRSRRGDDRSCRQPDPGQPVRCRQRQSPRLATKPTSTRPTADAHEACGRPESRTRPLRWTGWGAERLAEPTWRSR